MDTMLNFYNRRARKIESVCAITFLTLLLLKYGFMYTFVPLPSFYGTVMSASICIPLAIVLLIRKYDYNEFFISAALIFLGTISYLVSRDMVMFLALSAIVVLKNQPIHKLLKCFIVVRAMMLIILYTLVAVGVIENIEFQIDKSGFYSVFAYTFGHSHPNQLARNFASFIFAFVCVSDKKNYNFKLLLMLLATTFIFAATNCRTMIITVVFMLASAFIMQFRLFEKLISKLLKKLYVPIIAVFLFIGIICPYLIRSEIDFVKETVAAINTFVNGRIGISSIITELLPINLFGTGIDFSDITTLPIDCSYTVLLYKYGIVCTVIYLAIYSYACHYFIKKDKPIYSVCILITMLYALFENILWWPMVNAALILCSGAFMQTGDGDKPISVPALIDKLKTVFCGQKIFPRH